MDYTECRNKDLFSIVERQYLYQYYASFVRLYALSLIAMLTAKYRNESRMLLYFALVLLCLVFILSWSRFWRILI